MIVLMVVMMVVNTRCRREEGTQGAGGMKDHEGRHLTSDHGLPRKPLTRAVGLADY